MMTRTRGAERTLAYTAMVCGLAVGLAACQPMAQDGARPASASIAATPAAGSAAVAPSNVAANDPLAFTQAACGGCHAVESLAMSPNPGAPPFAAIANRNALSQASLAAWLTDAHNYPEMMDFDLKPAQVDAIAAHIISLRSADYQPYE